MDRDIIANIKSLAIDMINESKCGNSNITHETASIIYTLYSKHMNINVNDVNWLNRDRFVFSAGHKAALLYATLFMAGYNIDISDLKTFCKIDSITPYHPKLNVTPGVDATVESLGQGFATAVGMALGEKILETRYQLPKRRRLEDEKTLFDYKVYALCSASDLMEGISYEAASLASNLKLNNLIILYDSNTTIFDDNKNNSFTENVLARFESLGWNTQLVKNGNDINEIDKAISRAQGSLKPAIIEIKNIIDDKTALEDRSFDIKDVIQLDQNSNSTNKPFYVSDLLKQEFTINIFNRGNAKYKEWQKNYHYYVNEMLAGDENKFEFLNNKDIELEKYNWPFIVDETESLCDTNKKIMNIISENVKNFIGGSAGLHHLTKTYIENGGTISEDNYDSKNILFGMREAAMGAILNGLSLIGFKVFGSTLLSSSDYMKCSIRMSALMHLPVVYIFTYDSSTLGERNFIYQSVEQIAMLRSIPNLNVYRPADAYELAACWNIALKDNNPSALILTRQDVPILTNSDFILANKGAYIVRKEKYRLYAIIIATGSEVSLAINIADEIFDEYKADIRVVSMPSMNKFLEQNKKYQDEILPNGYKKFVIEAGSSYGWHRFVYNDNYLFTIDSYENNGRYIDKDTIKKEIKKLL